MKMVHCPFHDDSTPSMALYPDGHYHCYGCGAHGKLEDLPPSYWRHSLAPVKPIKIQVTSSALSLSSVSSAEEVRLLWAQAKSRVDKVMGYIQERHLMRAFAFTDFGYHDGRLIIPFRDANGGVRRLVGRATNRNAFPKYVLSGPKEFMPFIPDWSILRASYEVYFFFGIITAIAGRICGLPSMASPYGRTLSANLFLKVVEEFPLHFFYIVPDKGEEADAVRLYNAAVATGYGWRVSHLSINWPENTKDIDEVRIQYGDDVVHHLLQEARDE